MCSNVCTCLMCCSFVLSKCIECMIALFRQRAAHGLWVCAEDPSEKQPGEGKCPQTYHVLLYFIIHCLALHYLKLKDWLVCIYLTLVYLFGLIMVSLCYCFNLINEHDVIIYDTMMLSWCGSCGYFRGLRLFPEYLSVRTYLGSDNLG
jgi:hypothetical protein